MPDFEFSTHIDAPIERAWSVVSDIGGWPELTPSIDSVESLDTDSVLVGNRFSIKQPKLRQAVWTVTEIREGHSFTWESKSGGITTRGVHALTEENGGVKLTLSVHQSGVLAGIVGVLAGSTTRRYLSLEGNGIKKHSEQAAS
ncbi:SRPBCC family protein [Streptomyces sp. NBC_00005]|uniref:SRPBCC family protein n=1 Tax=Streptomyces sp. NBC_00005 TaxID=2903609 RepID=UPI0032493527